MFTLKNAEFNNPHFLQSLNALANEKLPVKVSWNLSRLFRQCVKSEQILRNAVVALGAKHFKKDESGNLTPILKDGIPVPGQYETLEEGGQEKFDAEFKELLDIDVALESFKIKLSDIENVSLTAQQISVLENILDDGEVVSLEVVK